MIPFDAAKFQRLMAEQGIDAIVATTRHNTRYLTGGYYHHFHARTGRSGQGQYLSGVGVPRDLRSPFHIGGGDEGALIERFGGLWIGERLRAVPGVPMTVGVAAQAAAALAARGLAAGTVGVELPFLPADAFGALRQRLPSATFVDATPLLGELRALKRPDELDRLRAVHRLTGEAIRVAMTDPEAAGRTTHELAAAVERAVGARGAGFLYCLASVGPSFVRAPGPERWESGRPLHLDAGAELGEFVSDICRMGSVGPVPQEARAMYDACIEASDRLRARLAPGVTCGDVLRLGQEFVQATRWGELGRFTAHGMGMVSHEPPLVIGTPDRPLEVGMVLSLETEFRRPDIGHIKYEDTVAITAAGGEGLGDAGREWCAAQG